MMSATSPNSSSPNPRVARAGVPIRSPDDTIGGRDLHASWRRAFPDSPTELRPVERPDASGISTAKAQRLLGWRPAVSWSDHLTADGQPR